MPSPLIPRSRSAPKISGNASVSPSTSDVLPVPSIQSLLSENSPRTYWPKKLNGFLRPRKPSSSSSKNQKLTEESLKEFNRLQNEILLEEKRYLAYSPYYRGLTDSSLVINPLMRVSSPTPNPAPDTESHAATFFSSSSKSSIVLRMQEWGSSCFLSPKHKEDRSSTSISGGRNNRTTSRYTQTTTSSPTPSSSSSCSRRKTINMGMTRETRKKSLKQPINENNEIRNSVKRTSDVPFTVMYEGKPLRERLSQSQSQSQPQPQPKPPSPPHPPLKKVAHQLESPPSTQPQPAQPPQTTSTKISATLASQAQPADSGSAIPVKESTMESEIKYIWADKYRPFTLKDFLCNRSTALQLQSQAIAGNCSHFIFEGPPGVGKRTMIWALLREAFGPDKVQAREECKKFILKGEAVNSISVNIKQSPQHVEVNLSELKGYEKHIIVELIMERYNKSNKECRAIILYEADKLPTEVLVYIRWILGRYQGGNKVFFCCSDASKIQPLESLCNIVKLLPPSTEEIIEVLEFISKEEGITLPHELAEKIANNSKNNLRQAIRSFEATWHFDSSLKENQEIMTGWEDDIANIAKSIIEEQSPKQLYNIRGKLQNLIEHNVSPEFIFETLIKELKKKLDGQLQKQIENLYEKYNRNEDSEMSYAQAQNRQEQQGRRLNDPVRKTVQQFMRIEEIKEDTFHLVIQEDISRVYQNS